MTITASQVNELREKTGVGLMDCKKVLVETDGNIEDAIKKLREKGLAKASKKSGRSTNEGQIFIKESDNSAVILELNCETDFVANNDQFKECGINLCQLILEKKINTLEELKSLTVSGKTYADFMSEYVMKLGENISVKQFKPLTNQEYLSSYIHMNGKIGVIVSFNKSIDNETAKSIAMHIAATNPAYLSPKDVDPTELDNEKEIIKKQALQEGKPEAIIEKITEGRINKYYKEVCLIEQAYIKDDKLSVKQVLGNGEEITKFIRFSLS
ncbi:elongation factor Ts [Candidatus Marinamargulisbacteria bacterium SCGC AG-343-D04]|nr:elongation factor Ts [Candidatus Marinamargulisbacteria bacterium SCGC AG-343-D04]